ncbi:MAG: insulinase family protein [Chloroflexi bacterium]|uniref:Insulinase family protein n=1 Tax=Candidatus Chlorohelix allophototropha TaxID=3003348 RepID=A0A8T7M829_9CHLR|nr:insulinase family protein [Chloroflexota bacterium]WJW68231.1 insulinase family protein [Chloroflexota bacterium L227-S17]
MGYEKTTLNNGVRVISNSMPHTQSVSTILYYGVGSRYEEDKLAGISHFIEHMVFKGTNKRPTAKAISEAIEAVGGVLNASTGREVTNYWAKVPKAHFPLAFDVLSDMMLNAKFDPNEIEKERKVIIEEIHMTLDSPPDLANEIIANVIWGDQPAGRDIAGNDETVGGIKREHLMSYLQKNYLPADMIVSVAGNIEHAEVVKMVEATLGQLPAGERPAAKPTVAVNGGPRQKIYFKETEQTNLCVAVPSLAYVDPRRYILSILDTIMGSGMSSRLFQEIREERGLCYTVDSYASQMSDTGAWIVYSGVDPDNTDETITAILGEMRKIRDERVSDAELLKAKEYNKGRMLLGLEDTRAVASWAGNQELLLDRILTVEEVVERIEAVTAEQIQELAKEMFTDENLRLSVVGPYKDQDERFLNLLKF